MKADLKRTTGAAISNLATNLDLAGLKAKVDKKDTSKQKIFLLKIRYSTLVIYNHGPNILRILVTLPNFIFTTNETTRDYW